MEPTSVVVAVDLIGKVSKVLNSVRERAKRSKDAALNENISGLYDDFLDLKAMVLRLTEENAELRGKLAAQAVEPQKPEIRQVGETNYYYVGEQGPYCQPCYDGNGKLVRLMPPEQHSGGTCRKCRVCRQVFYEETKPVRPVSLRRRRPWG